MQLPGQPHVTTWGCPRFAVYGTQVPRPGDGAHRVCPTWPCRTCTALPVTSPYPYEKELFLMKRTDFSVDWLFAACAPDTELLPWNAQFTPRRPAPRLADSPRGRSVPRRHAVLPQIFLVTDVPGTRRMLWFGGPTWIRPFSSTAPKSANGSTATRPLVRHHRRAA